MQRDKFIRQSLYPGIIFTSPSTPSIFGSDGYGIVVSPTSSPLHNKRVLIHCAEGWISDPTGPDQDRKFSNFGNVAPTGGRGTFAEYMAVGEDHIVEVPGWLGEEGAAIPLAAVTAWRAVVTKAGVKKGHNALITGIGGGVALMALQFCVAIGKLSSPRLEIAKTSKAQTFMLLQVLRRS